MLPHNFDTTLYEYYLKTSLGDCETKSYYNKASLTGVELTKFNGAVESCQFTSHGTQSWKLA